MGKPISNKYLIQPTKRKEDGPGCDSAEYENMTMGVEMEVCDDCFGKLRLMNVEDCLLCRYKDQVAVVGSDFIALFTSLQERNTGKIVAEEVRQSEQPGFAIL